MVLKQREVVQPPVTLPTSPAAHPQPGPQPSPALPLSHSTLRAQTKKSPGKATKAVITNFPAEHDVQGQQEESVEHQGDSRGDSRNPPEREENTQPR